MRLFRRGGSTVPLKEHEEVRVQVRTLEETKKVQRERLERTLNDYYGALEQSRRFATELHHLQSKFNAFVWQQALETNPEHELIQGYINDVTHLTAELVADITEEES